MAKPSKRAPKPASVSILDFMSDANLLGWAFQGPSWAIWRVFLAALFGLPLTKAEQEIYLRHTGRHYVNDLAAAVTYAVLICGRRSGKSRILALTGIFLAVFVDWRKYIAAGETGTVLIIAASRDQAKVIFKYVRGMLRETPMLARLIRRETAETIELTNGIEIKITAASFRTTRGMTTVAILADETAFWPTDESSAEQDIEIMRALKPSTLTVPGARVMIASSPYSKRGLLWQDFRRLHGRDVLGELCWRGTTVEMNPSIPAGEIEAEIAKDPAAGRSEYLAQFRDDLETYISREAVEAVVLPGVREIARVSGVHYTGFIDAAGGSGGDSMTCAIAHFEAKDGLVVLDAVREVKPRFSPESVVREFAKLFKSYGISRAYSDRWGGAFVVEAFAREGIKLDPAERTKSEFYGELLPAINSGKCRLLDHEHLINQLCILERRTGRGTGRDFDRSPSWQP